MYQKRGTEKTRRSVIKISFSSKFSVYYNKEIIPQVKLVPEAQPRDTNNQGVLSLLSTLGRKHILMARSIAEGPNF